MTKLTRSHQLESRLLPRGGSSAAAAVPHGHIDLDRLLGLTTARDVAHLSGLIKRWIHPPSCGEEGRLDLIGSKEESLVLHMITEDRRRAPSFEEDGGKRKIGSDFRDVLTMLKEAAADPCYDRAGEDQEWEGQALRSRKALCIKREEFSDWVDFPYQKTKRHKYYSEISQNMNIKKLNQPKRRSQRLLDLEKFGDILSTDPSKSIIPTGDHAQADLPDWIGPLERNDGSEDNLDESRWLGTTIWPVKCNDTEVNLGSIGQGRLDFCACVSPGSVDCIKLHVKTARRHLRSDLGLAFFDWRFEQMGEDVSKTWTLKEHLKFQEILRLNRESEDKNFLDEALKHIPTKSRRDIVSYYFNVYVLRRIRRDTRLKSEAADSVDNVDEQDSNRAFDVKNIKDCEAGHAKCSKQSFIFFGQILLGI